MGDYQLSRFLDRLNLVAVILDSRGHIRFANKYFIKTAGWASDEIMGKSWCSQFVTPGTFWKMAQLYIKSENRNDDFAFFDGELLMKNGEPRKMSFLVFFLRDSDRQISGIVKIGEEFACGADMLKKLAKCIYTFGYHIECDIMMLDD